MDFIRKIQELDIVKNIQKRRSERSNVMLMEKKKYGSTEIVASVFLVIWGTIINAMVFYVFVLTWEILSGNYHTPFSFPTGMFVAKAIIFGFLTSAAMNFLIECKKFRESSQIVFHRLTKKEAEDREAKKMIERMKEHSNRREHRLKIKQIERSQVNEVKQKIGNREKELNQNSLILLVFAGLAMIIHWAYKQMLRYFAYLLIFTTLFVLIWEFEKGDGKELHALFSNSNFTFGVFMIYSVVNLLLFFIKGMSRQQFIGGSSYFWKMLDEYKLKRRGLLLSDKDMPFGEPKDDILLNRLQQQVKSNRKRGRSRQ